MALYPPIHHSDMFLTLVFLLLDEKQEEKYLFFKKRRKIDYSLSGLYSHSTITLASLLGLLRPCTFVMLNTINLPNSMICSKELTKERSL